MFVSISNPNALWNPIQEPHLNGFDYIWYELLIVVVRKILEECEILPSRRPSQVLGQYFFHYLFSFFLNLTLIASLKLGGSTPLGTRDFRYLFKSRYASRSTLICFSFFTKFIYDIPFQNHRCSKSYCKWNILSD